MLIQYPYLETLHIENDQSGEITSELHCGEKFVNDFLKFLEANKTLKSISLGYLLNSTEEFFPLRKFTQRLIKVIENNISLNFIEYKTLLNDGGSDNPRLQQLLQRNRYIPSTNSIGSRQLADALEEMPAVLHSMISQYHGSFFFAKTRLPENPIITALETYHLKNKDKKSDFYNKGLIAKIAEIAERHSDNVPALLDAIKYLQKKDNLVVLKLNSQIFQKESENYINALQILLKYLVQFAPLIV